MNARLQSGHGTVGWIIALGTIILIGAFFLMNSDESESEITSTSGISDKATIGNTTNTPTPNTPPPSTPTAPEMMDDKDSMKEEMEETMEGHSPDDMMDDKEMMDDGAEMMDKKKDEMTDETMDDTAEPTAVIEAADPQPLAAGVYTEYSKDKVASAADGTTLVFFHASWCPSCNTLDKDLVANEANIPADVTILKADFDSQTELKKQYGVTKQHTLVEVDADGNKIRTLTGLTNSLDQVLKQL